MVKGLKVLRHKRTEAGYFNEFLIAKTPDDVENCVPLLLASPGVAATSASAAPAGVATSHAHLQTSTYTSGSTSADLVINSIPSAAPVWHQHQHQHQQHYQRQQHQYQQHQQLQQQLTLLCFSNPEVEQQIVSQPAAAATTAIACREETVVSTAAATARQQSGMAAGMSKMRFDLGRGTSSSSGSGSGARDSSRRQPPPAAGDAATTTTTTTAAESQRRASRRRERNRAAAARCRRKRQDQLDCLGEAVRALETENAGLESRVAALAAVRSDLLSRLRQHRLNCPDGPTAADTAADDISLAAAVSPLDTDLASLATVACGEEVLLTPSLLLPPPLPSPTDPSGAASDCDFKLEPL